MKKGIFALLAGVAVLSLTGCVNTVTEQKTGGMPAFRDRVEGRYERSLSQVYDAAKRALNSFGNISAEGQLHTTTNQVRTIEGFVNQNAIYMRVEAVTPAVTSIIVQVRTKWGGTDLQVAHELEKRVALELN
jgi:uncharacterized lipoprotein NlpE involved in copper resistance